MVDHHKHGQEFVAYHKERGTATIEVEKRYLQRIPTDKKLYIGDESGQIVSARLVNLSGSGVLIDVDSKFKIDQVLDIRIDEDEPPFAVVRVMRIAKEGASYGVKWLRIYTDQLPKGLLTKQKV